MQQQDKKSGLEHTLSRLFFAMMIPNFLELSFNTLCCAEQFSSVSPTNVRYFKTYLILPQTNCFLCQSIFRQSCFLPITLSMKTKTEFLGSFTWKKSIFQQKNWKINPDQKIFNQFKCKTESN